MMTLNLLLVLCAVVSAFAFRSNFFASRTSSTSVALRALDSSVIDQLNEIKSRYNRLLTVVSDESEAEAKKLKSIVDTYYLYKEMDDMLVRLKVLYTNENTERRREKQMKSIVEAVTSKAELEELLKEELGLPFSKQPVLPAEIAVIQQTSAKISSLKSELEKITVKIPEGKSTAAARFGALAHQK